MSPSQPSVWPVRSPLPPGGPGPSEGQWGHHGKATPPVGRWAQRALCLEPRESCRRRPLPKHTGPWVRVTALPNCPVGRDGGQTSPPGSFSLHAIPSPSSILRVFPLAKRTWSQRASMSVHTRAHGCAHTCTCVGLLASACVCACEHLYLHVSPRVRAHRAAGLEPGRLDEAGLECRPRGRQAASRAAAGREVVMRPDGCR